MTVFSFIVILALCVMAVSAATLNPNLVYNKITVTTTSQIYDIAKPAEYSLCPVGYDCLTEADAAAQLGTYEKYSDTVCGYKQSTATMAAVVRTPKYCVKKKEVTPSPVVCANGCSCISEATAKVRGGTWSRCSADICGYEQSTATLAAAVRVPKYCMKQESTNPTCPEGCVCLSDVNAKARYGDYTRCSADICGYDVSAVTGALAATQVPKYCIKQATTTPVCPEGCACLTDAKAKERYGTYTRCTAEVCGYETSTLTTAAYQIPEYCVKQGSTPVCADGCICISDEDAKLKGLTERCDNSQSPCGYKSVDATTTSAARRIPLYCYKTPTTTPVCKEGCYCLQEAEAKLKFGPNNYTRCQADTCGYDPSATTANGIPKYCFNPTITPTLSGCLQGCACITNATAVEKGLTFCGGTLTSCGYDENKQPLYCFVGQGSSPICPQGCTCTTNATAVEKGLTFCGGKLISCGYNENKQPLYCFEEGPSPTCIYDYPKNVCSGTCDQGYTCGLSASKKDATGKVVYAVCGCTEPPIIPCTYDAQKNACTGTCQTGASCSVVGKNVDEKTGATTLICGCPQQSSCVYDYSRESCVGTCTATGEKCQLNTIYRDPTTGKVTYAECHCKGGGETIPTCACDVASGSCTGTCADTKACTMTEHTMDNAGKVTCSTCECRDTCVLTANNECSGTCLTGEPCARIVTKDDSGQEKVSCGCRGSQSGTPSGVATRQPGIFESIVSFINKLFGGK